MVLKILLGSLKAYPKGIHVLKFLRDLKVRVLSWRRLQCRQSRVSRNRQNLRCSEQFRMNLGRDVKILK